jgi:protein SCO1/2
MLTHCQRTLCLGALVALVLAVCAGSASAQLIEKLPAEMQGVGIDDKSSSQIPLDLRFRDENGKAVTLAEVFSGDRPVLLSLNYSDCPMLCGLQLNGLFDTLTEIKGWSPGREFDVVSVSVDPLETTLRAKQTEQKYLERYGRAGAAEGVRFLTGNAENIRALADAVGFRYKYVPDTREYSHTAAEIVVTPKGVVSRYLYGVAYDPQTVRLSLIEAADGKIGSPLDQIILFCFHYDETKGRYGPVARRVMSVGAGVTIFAMCVGLMPYWLRRPSKTAPSINDDPSTNPTKPQAAEREPIEVA